MNVFGAFCDILCARNKFDHFLKVSFLGNERSHEEILYYSEARFLAGSVLRNLQVEVYAILSQLTERQCVGHVACIITNRNKRKT
jgi:hypothetical protein